MKIKRSELPEHVASSLKAWERWVELDDEPQEPARKPPEPGQHFLHNGKLAIRSTGKDSWAFIADENFCHLETPYIVWPLSGLPDNWQPLSEVIAKAARCEELKEEARTNARTIHRQNVAARQKQEEIDGLKRQVEYWEKLCEEVSDKATRCDEAEDELNQEQHARRHWEESAGNWCSRANELEAKLKQQDAELVRSRATVKDRSVTIETLSQIIEEQNFLLDKVHSAFNYTDMHTARRMLDERKAQEAQ